jgi:outer membrane receptor protein involved in Fe transport
LSLDQDFALTSDVTGFVGATVGYAGERVGIFSSVFANPPLRQNFPSYTKTDLRTGVRFDAWTANLYVNNIADERGVLRGGLDSFLHYAFNYIEPRTVGLSVSKNF